RGFGCGVVVIGAGDRVHTTQHLGEFIGPARVVDPTVDGGGNDPVGLGPSRPLEGHHLIDELGSASLQDLGDPVQDLAPVVGGASGPVTEGLACGDDGVTGVLAGGEGGVGQVVSVCGSHGV